MRTATYFIFYERVTAMSMYAYKDAARTIRVLAKEITERDKGIRHYCPNPKCEARMFIRSYDGERKSVFVASGNPGHIEYCPYGLGNTYNPEKTKEEGFNSDDAISNLMTVTLQKKASQTKIKGKVGGASEEAVVPHTILQIYNMCKAHYCKDTFNGQTIGQILLDGRSIYMYPKGVFGYRIIEAKCKKYLYDDKNIYLETPVDNVKYDLKLHFEDEELFTRMKKLLYANQNHPIAIAGKWENSRKYNCFFTEVVSDRQIKVLKQEL